MQRFLNLTLADQQTAFEQTAAARGLVASSVEKDFWVSWALRELFQLYGLDGSLIFKGGTSLSKAWGLIDRFSEDIDLTIDRRTLGFDGEKDPANAPSNKKRKKLLQDLRSACEQYVQREIRPAMAARLAAATAGRDAQLELDKGDGQTLLLRYPVQRPGASGTYIAPVVRMEFGARSDPWPAETRPIRSFVAEKFPEQFETPEFSVAALLPKRTFLEKAMLLHEETHRPADKRLKLRMARHYYDLHRLIEQGIGAEVLEDLELFTQVANHRKNFFEQNWVDYENLKPETLRLIPRPDQLQAWRDDYAAMGPEMFQNTPPSFDQLLNSAQAFQDQINKPRADGA